jgi:hypothetical protein
LDDFKNIGVFATALFGRAKVTIDSEDLMLQTPRILVLSYKKELHARDIVLHQAIRAPASAKQLLSVLNSKSPRNRSQRG